MIYLMSKRMYWQMINDNSWTHTDVIVHLNTLNILGLITEVHITEG